MGFSDWRRKRVLKRARIDEALWTRVASKLSFLRGLSDEESTRLKQLVVVFLAEKEMHGAQGLQLTDEARLSIAAQACLPIPQSRLGCLRRLVGVVVFQRIPRTQRGNGENASSTLSMMKLAGEACRAGR